MPRKIDKWIPCAWMAVLVLVPVLRMGPELFAPILYTDDARIFSFVFWQDQNPALLPGDPIARYIRKGMMPPAYAALGAQVASWFSHPLVGMHIVSIVLMIVTATTVFLCAYRLGGKWTGALAAALILQNHFVGLMIAGALPRAFRLPVLCTGLACWMWQRDKLALLVQLIAAFLSPIAYVLLAVTGGLRVLLGLRRGISKRLNLVLFGLVHIVAIVYLLTWIEQKPYGGVISGPEALSSDPHWSGEAPRVRYDPVKSVLQDVRGHVRDSRPVLIPGDLYRAISQPIYRTVATWWIPWLALSVLAIGVFSKRWRRVVIMLKTLLMEVKKIAFSCMEMILMLTASAIMYCLARSVPLLLYFPDRHLVMVPIILIVLGTCLLHRLVLGIVGYGLPLQRPAKFLMCGVVLFSTIGEFQREPRTYGFNMKVLPDSVAVLQAISTLPKTAMIFATGRLADDIPLLCARSVVWNIETYQIHHLSYVEDLDARIRTALDAILTPEWQVARRKLQKLGITHLVYDKELWSVPQKRDSFLLSPLREEYGLRLVSAGPEELIWKHIPAQNRVFEGKRYKLWAIDSK